MLQPRRNNLLCLLLVLFACTSAHALGPNRDQPIRVVSDRAELDEQKGISTYTGNVVITQGLTRLDAEEVVIHSTEAGQISKLIATGKQAHYQEQETTAAPVTHAYADTIIYNQADETITLIENARLEQNKNSFQGAEIQYHTVNRKVIASAGTQAGNGGRVEMIFHPQPKESTNGEASSQP